MDLQIITAIGKALSDGNRVAIVDMLGKEEMCAADILERIDIAQSTLVHHLRILLDAGIISPKKKKGLIYYCVSSEFGENLSMFIDNVTPAEQLERFEQREKKYYDKLYFLAEEARRQNAEKTDFLIRMSHDLRTPIDGIKGMITIAGKNMQDSVRVEDCLSKINTAASQLEEMVNEILDLSDLENDKESFVELPFCIYDTSREINNLYLPRFEKANIEYKTAIKGEIKHPYVLSNRTYLKSIYQVLLDNALKNTKAGGILSVEIQEVSETDKTVSFNIVIRNTGMFLDMMYIQKILELHKDRNEMEGVAERGAGLGISVVNRLLDRIGGQLQIKSSDTEGVTISITVTHKIDLDAEKAFTSNPEQKIFGKRVLLVEDAPLSLEVAQFILEDAGASVATATDGLEAVEIIKHSAEGEFDFVLMDIMMPIMNGYDAARIIRSLDRKDVKKIPIIAMSASAFEEDIQKTLEAGMNDHLSKPVNPGKLLASVSRLL